MNAALTTTAYRKREMVTHHARVAWMLLGATIAVVAGFATLNIFLADSGLAVLNEHTAHYLPFISRLTRQT